MSQPPLVQRIGLHAKKTDGEMEFPTIAALAELLGWEGSNSSLKRSLEDLYRPRSGDPQIVFLSPSLRRRLGETDAVGYKIAIPQLVERAKAKYL